MLTAAFPALTRLEEVRLASLTETELTGRRRFLDDGSAFRPSIWVEAVGTSAALSRRPVGGARRPGS